MTPRKEPSADGSRCDTSNKSVPAARIVEASHVADISAGVAALLRLEVIAVGKIGAALHRLRLARSERAAVAADQDDGLHLRHDSDDALQARGQAPCAARISIVRHAAHDLVDLREDAVDGLEHLERLFLQHVERATDALVGDGIDVAIVVIGGVERTAPPEAPATRPSTAAADAVPIPVLVRIEVRMLRPAICNHGRATTLEPSQPVKFPGRERGDYSPHSIAIS